MTDLPPDKVRRWCLATTAILNTINHASHDHLGGGPIGSAASTNAAAILRNSWGVDSREKLADMVQWLQGGGHDDGWKEAVARFGSASPAEIAGDPKLQFVAKHKGTIGAKGLAAWDHCRAISLVGWAVCSGMLPESEGWRWILPSARKLQNTYTSWQDLGEGYTLGCAWWSAAHEQECRDAMAKLAADPKSPWKTTPWKTDLFADDTPSGLSQWLGPRLVGCVFSLIAGVIGLVGFVVIFGYVLYSISSSGGFDGVRSAGAGIEAVDEPGGWDGRSPFSCGGTEKVTLTGVVAALDGTAITAAGNCKLTLDGVTISAGTALLAQGNAKVTVTGGALTGSDHAIDAQGNSSVTLEGTAVSGDVKHSLNAKVIGP